MQAEQESTARILVVDDKPENIGILFELLSKHGFAPVVAESGEAALEIVDEEPPDLILLDVMMPGIDGFETCQRLKRDPKSQDIPVIFMTALTDIDSKVRGLDMGAVDYVTKPVQQKELLARVRTHIHLRDLQRNLEKRNQELDSFARTVAHDLKNPIASLLTLHTLLEQELPRGEPVSESAHRHIELVGRAAQQAYNIVDALLLLARTSHEQVKLEVLDMGQLVEEVLRERLRDMIGEFAAQVTLPDNWPKVRAYAPWVTEIWANYLSNAIKYGGQPPHIQIGSNVTDDGQIRYWVRDNGQGLSAEAQARLFTPFVRLHRSSVGGHGLGLTIVRQITDKLGGQAGVESAPEQGSLFWFSLPEC